MSMLKTRAEQLYSKRPIS